MHAKLLATPFAILVSLALSLGCASSLKVNSDYDPSVDFASLKTWSWVEDEPRMGGDAAAKGNSLLTSRVSDAVEQSMGARGYQQVESNADFRMAFSFGTKEQIDVRTSPSTGGYYGGGYRGRYGGVYSGWGGTQVDVSQYTEGTLVIDILEPKGEKLLWRGTGTTRLREIKDPQKRIQKINEGVDKILSQFPPEKK